MISLSCSIIYSTISVLGLTFSKSKIVAFRHKAHPLPFHAIEFITLYLTVKCMYKGEYFMNKIFTGTDLHSKKVAAFTLAEVLITLGVIGIVAAITIPSLMTNIQDKVKENQVKVFKSKVVKGFNLTKAAGKLNNTYSGTEDFLKNGLGSHLKLVSVCGPTNLENCIPYSEIIYSNDGVTEETLEVKNLNTVEKLNLKTEDGFKDVGAFILADGTIVIGSYKTDCMVDDGKIDIDISSCFAGLYDLNGSRKPNKLGKDLLPINGASIHLKKAPTVLATLGGVKIISAAVVNDPIPVSDYCENGEPKKDYKDAGVTTCCTNCTNSGDVWVVAMKACYDAVGTLPSEQQLADIANALYGGRANGSLYSASDGYMGNYDGAHNIGQAGVAIPESLAGIGSDWWGLWASSGSSSSSVMTRQFDTSKSIVPPGSSHNNYGIRSLCVLPD